VGHWRQTIPSRRTSHREGAALSENSPCTGDYSNSACAEERNEIRRLIATVGQQWSRR